MYGDYLFSEFERLGSKDASSLIGGSDKLTELYANFRQGEGSAAAVLNAALQNTADMNLFYIRPVLNYLIFNRIQESLSPGYLKKMQEYFMREEQALSFNSEE